MAHIGGFVDALCLPDVVALRCVAGLEYLRRAGVRPNARVAEAIELVESKCDGDVSL